MHSPPEKCIIDRERQLIGLSSMLAPADIADLLMANSIELDGPVQVDYVRYKPERRCMCLVRSSSGAAGQSFVVTAFTSLGFAKQYRKTQEAAAAGQCRHDEARQIRIDHFPYDPELRPMHKCFDADGRARVLRRTLGKAVVGESQCFETLAYKPGRRFVAACPKHTLKFYARPHYDSTLKRLRGISRLACSCPKVTGWNEHYRVIALEWLTGQQLAELFATGQADLSLLYEVGDQLARLHATPLNSTIGTAVNNHRLDELSHYIAWICPELSTLVTEVARQIEARLIGLRQRQSLIHADFYAKQVLVDELHVKFIDFDQCGSGNPYQDLGNFVAQLHWQTTYQSGDRSLVERWEEALLKGYCQRERQFDELAYRTHFAAGLLRCATHPFRRSQADWPNATRQLLMLAQAALCTSVPRALARQAELLTRGEGAS